METIGKKVAAGAGAVAVALGLLAFGAAPANANLSAWDSIDFSGTLLVSSSATAVIDVPDDRTRSTKNFTDFGYSARNTTGPGFSEEVVYFPSGTQLNTYGSSNDTVDHFDRVG